MIKLALIYVVLVIAVEAITELFVASRIFEKPRQWINSVLHYIHLDGLIDCGYCMSVWVAGAMAFVAPGAYFNWWVDFLLKLLVLHRVSNVVHEAIHRWVNRAPFVIVLHTTDYKDGVINANITGTNESMTR